LKKVSHKIEIVIVSISKPLLIGVYIDGDLVEYIKREEKTSDILLWVLMDIKRRYNYNRVIYTNGPGSYMAIKLTYIILRTLQITQDIDFDACDAFSLNNQKPIKAMGKLYFIKEKDNIITKKINEPVEQEFKLPLKLNEISILDSNEPLYILPAV
jgi:hypothetical protein